MSLSFDGVNDTVTRAAFTEGVTRTYFVRIKPTALTGGLVSRVTTQRSQLYFDALNYAGRLGWYALRTTYGGWWMAPPGAVVVGAWHSIAATYDGSSLANAPVVYVNGSPVRLQLLRVPVGTENADATELKIGNVDAVAGFGYVNGLVEDFAEWNRILTPDEIRLVHYTNPNNAAVASGLQLYWAMNQAGGPSAADTSGNGRNGTLNGGVAAGADAPVLPATLPTFHMAYPTPFAPITAEWIPTVPNVSPGSGQPTDRGVLVDVMGDGSTWSNRLRPERFIRRWHFDQLSNADVDAYLAFLATVGGATFALRDTIESTRVVPYINASLVGSGLAPTPERQAAGKWGMDIDLRLQP